MGRRVYPSRQEHESHARRGIARIIMPNPYRKEKRMNEIQLQRLFGRAYQRGKRLRPLSSQNLRRRQLQRLPVRHEPQTSQAQMKSMRSVNARRICRHAQGGIMSVSSLKREEILKWHRSKAATPEYTRRNCSACHWMRCCTSSPILKRPHPTRMISRPNSSKPLI